MQLCSKCKKQMPSRANEICQQCITASYLRKCPYCESSRGFYYDRSIKQRVSKTFNGSSYTVTNLDTIYQNTVRYCIKCDEKITSYVKSLGVE